MRLFYTAGSPYARIARVALIETGLDARCGQEEVTLRDPGSALLPFNPNGRVPSLETDDGVILSESLLILAYLDTQHGGRRLLPMDGTDSWRTLARLGLAYSFLEGIAVWNRALRPPPGERSPAAIAHEEGRAARTADALERAVAEGGYSGPIDAGRIVLGAALGYCDRRHRVWNWREGRPALAAWQDETAGRPSFAATLPPEA